MNFEYQIILSCESCVEIVRSEAVATSVEETAPVLTESSLIKLCIEAIERATAAPSISIAPSVTVSPAILVESVWKKVALLLLLLLSEPFDLNNLLNTLLLLISKVTEATTEVALAKL